LDDVFIMVEVIKGKNLNARIADAVRRLRTARGLSLESLAAESSVSRSMLSLIERGESNATAVVLDKVATALGVSLATLFDDAKAPASPLARAASRSAWRDPDSGYIRRNISPPNYPSPIQIVDVALPAGAHVAYETGARDAPIHQQVWVRDGKLVMRVGAKNYELATDDCLAMQLNESIVFRNPTRKTTRYVVVLSAQGDIPRGSAVGDSRSRTNVIL
jgi:transcriptional regulator with XRE-family HTH domain